MKMIVVSDIHKMEQREEILRFFEGKKFDAILVNGDVIGEYQIPQAVKEFGAMNSYLRASDGASLIKRCAPIVGPKLVEFFKKLGPRYPDDDEIDELKELIRLYGEERYNGVIDFLKKLTKSGHVFFNYGESESPYGLAIENEISQLLGADPEIIMELRSEKIFPRFEAALFDMDKHTPLFDYVSGETAEFRGFVIAGIPGVFEEARGGEPAQEQEAKIMRVVDKLENAGPLILMHHSAAPATGVFGKTMGSDTLLEFLKERMGKTIVVNSHYHLLNSVFLKVEKVYYIVPVAAINDEISMIDTELVRYYEIHLPSGKITELSSVRLTDWDESVPDLLKRMY